MIADMLLFDDDASAVCGHVLIYDLQGLSLGHVGQFTPSFIKYEMSISTFILYRLHYFKSIPFQTGRQ